MFNFNSRSVEKDNKQYNFNEDGKPRTNQKFPSENNNKISKNFEEALETILKGKVNLETCSEIIFKNDKMINNSEEKKALNFLNPNFMVSSDKNEALYLLLPRIEKDRKIVYQFFCFYEVSDRVEIRELFVKFESKNIKQTNKINSNYARNINQKLVEETEFLCKGIEIHSKNQNQLCFYSKDKIAFIKDLNSLKDLQDNETIECIVNHELDFQYKHKNIYYKKFKFSDFDDYFGLISTDNIFSLYSIEKVLPEITFNFDSNIVDFDFGRVAEMDILQPFSLFFLNESGEILTCSPFFPKLFNAEILNSIENFTDLKQDIITTKENRLYDKEHIHIDDPRKDEEEYLKGKIIKNLNICTKIKKDDGSKPKLEQKQIIFGHKKVIEINDFLSSFNRNIILKTINISEKNINLIDKSRNARSLSNLNFSEKSFYKKYTQLHVLSSFPITFLRIFENNVLEIISMIDEIKPLNLRNSIYKKEDVNLNAALTEIINFNHYPDMDLADLKIIKNKFDSSEILINNISDLYLLKVNDIDICADPNQVQFRKSELRKIIKIDYLKKKNIENINQGYVGVDFLYSKGNRSQIVVIKTNSENKFSPYLFPTLVDDNKKFIKNINRKKDLKNFDRIRCNFEKVLTHKKANEYFSRLEHFYKLFIQEEYNSTEIKYLDNYRKPFQIDKEMLQKIMESGISNNIEGFFYYIFNFYNNFFSDRSFYLLNKMNVLQELYDKMEFFRMSEKRDLLEKINFNINIEVKKIQKKRALIITKLSEIKIKLTKMYFTQEDFRNDYVLFKEKITQEMTNTVLSLKKNMVEMNSYLLTLENKAKNLLILRNRFNSEYLDEENKNKMVLFTNFFLNFFNSVAKLKDDII